MPIVHLAITSSKFEKLSKTKNLTVPSGSVKDILKKINTDHPGILPLIIDGSDRIRSGASLVRNVVAEGDRIFIEKEKSIPIESANEIIGDEENLLISIFDLGFFEELFDKVLTPGSEKFSYLNEDGRANKSKYRGYITKISREHILHESVKDFVISDIGIGQLEFDLVNDVDIRFKPGDSTIDRFLREQSRIVPSPLIDAIVALLADPEQEDGLGVRLRLFQEDCLFFVLGKLWAPESIPERALLLSMPTGGGKTEAFVFPLVSHILIRKANTLKLGQSIPHSIKALILYPTKALANDQAKRLAEIIQKVQQSIEKQGNLPPELGISIGIFTGDTVSTKSGLQDGLGNFLSLFQVCPVCDQSNFELDSQEINSKEIIVQKCKYCGHRMTYLRVTRADIFNAPPDILITNPDTLNYHIQIPERQEALLQDVEIMIFDEVHEYNGIFGCNVAHLLRRIENRRMGHPPFYVGLSATIGNAENLAALLFNVPPEEVLYIRDNEERPYLRSEKISRRRSHFLATPNMYDSVDWLKSYPLTTTINLTSAIGHAIRDPQFRKILIFSNFKADHDKLSFQIPENERDYVAIYRDELREAVISNSTNENIPTLTASDRRVIRQVAKWFEWEKEFITTYEPNLNVGWHRGALEMEERVRAVNRFATLTRIKTGGEGLGCEYPTDVMVATKTLELGVDIGNVSVVINSSAPFSNNDYVQRIGRGGRRKDGLAVTIINPNNAIDAYMREHFHDFVFPQEYEDAPIIASNELILRSHLYARILDYLASQISVGWQITVGDWLEHTLFHNGKEVRVDENPSKYAEALFQKIFPGKQFDNFANWFLIEQRILSSEESGTYVEPFTIEKKNIIDELRYICEKLKTQTDPGTKGGWDEDSPLTGMGAVFDQLRPSLRGSGKNVNLYLKKSRGENEWKDEISRDRAIYQNPPGSFQSQGRNLFLIEDILKEDKDAEEEIIELLVDNDKAYEYFLRHFPESSLQSPPKRAYKWRIRTPEDLLVRHYPGRYHCSNPRCGLTYTANEVTDDLRCMECNWPLNQVTRIYRCPQCNSIAEPPVPKLCINPNCIRGKLDRDPQGKINAKWNLRIAMKKAIRDKSPVPLRGFFRFESRPNLEWKCMDCGTVISLHDRKVALNVGTPSSLPDNRSIDGSDAHLILAWYGLYRPESPILNKRTYLNLGYNLNGYDCPDIENCPAHWRGGLRAVNLPRYQTDIIQFHIAGNSIGQSRETRLGDIYFFKGHVISLAERYALSDPKEDENEAVNVTRNQIFEGGELYATKFSPHMFGLKLRERLDSFLLRVPCMTTNCDKCEEILSIELGELYRPQMHLTPRFIEDGKPVQPDPRAVWCDVNRQGNCPSINCRECDYFEWNNLRRFAVLHTVLHGVLWALPKYTGLDVGSFKGVVNPGFLSNIEDVPNDLDLLIVDMNDGGSGAIHLVNRWWESHIEPMAIEILKLASLPKTNERRANLNLPYTCSWFNGNLCPVLTGKFISELTSKQFINIT
jgi:hypothetical protein